MLITILGEECVVYNLVIVKAQVDARIPFGWVKRETGRVWVRLRVEILVGVYIIPRAKSGTCSSKPSYSSEALRRTVTEHVEP